MICSRVGFFFTGLFKQEVCASELSDPTGDTAAAESEDIATGKAAEEEDEKDEEDEEDEEDDEDDEDDDERDDEGDEEDEETARAEKLT